MVGPERRTGQLILVVGGASSGKSAMALTFAGGDMPRAFIATGQALDDDMTKRISHHQRERGPDWETAEVPVELEQWFLANGRSYRTVVLDCLTLWLSNLREHGVPDEHIPELVCGLLRAMRTSTARVIVVTNELGLGLVPMDAAARAFRDLAGKTNQLCARHADEVYFVVSGMPIQIKSHSTGNERAVR
jgi:adenosylcobinamide kinase / adenosylcobinamide-phosphate guanylyltransferase